MEPELSLAPDGHRTVPVPPDEPLTAPLLDAYFLERERGFPGAHAYRVTRPDPAAFVPPAGTFLRLDAQYGEPIGSGAVGCGGVRTVPPGPLGPRLEVKHLFVLRRARGWGGGRVLLDALEAWARDAGAAELVLDTNRSLEAAAGLYRSSGFVPIEPYNDNPNATDWLGKPLR